MDTLFSRVPSSVYRFQMSSSFTLQSVCDLLFYLRDLGVEGICLSPLFESVTAGGYDIVDPNRFNSEICSEAEFEVFLEKIAKLEIKLIFDVVPNHMGIRGRKNLWWIDVLKKGESSPFARFFDIDWVPPNPCLKGKVLLPILLEPYKTVLEKGEIELVWEDGFWIRYFDHWLPLCSQSLSEEEAVADILERFKESPERVEELLERQHYRLCYWKMAGEEINYRRFFNINELAAIHIEDETVFKEHHRFLLELLEKKKIQGLRIDHPDGLFDPGRYFERLRAGGASLILAEKILDFQETLPEEWDIEGTVGYDFLNIVNGFFIQRKSEQEFNEIYSSFLGYELNFGDVAYERRKKYIDLEMGSQIRSLSLLLGQIALSRGCDFSGEDLKRILEETIACYPVYRTYLKPGKKERKKDREYLEQAIEKARKRVPDIHSALFDFLKTQLSLANSVASQKELFFIMRFEQLTAPAMAKGLEDSAFYVYNRLISLNEVGGYPSIFGISREDFHSFNQEKLAHWPLGSLASSTHDTKFSEDARMRLNVLSEIPERWRSLVLEWKKQNRQYKTRIGEKEFPDPNAEYFLYQLMIALWPVSEDRLWLCFFKSIREAGIYTSWLRPSKEYEAASEQFLRALLSPQSDHSFLASFNAFHEEIARAGALNSLSAVVMKMGSCGIADLYQGDEYWNFRHVDPDNRSDVDYVLRKKLLAGGEEQKLWTLSQLLLLRKNRKELFLQGEYVPLTISSERVIGWMRRHGSDFAIFLVGRFFFDRKEWEGEAALPEGFSQKELVNLFTKENVSLQEKEGRFFLPLSEVFRDYSFAVLCQ